MGLPQAQTYSFQSSTVTYGGAIGACYTSPITRRMGGDEVNWLVCMFVNLLLVMMFCSFVMG